MRTDTSPPANVTELNISDERARIMVVVPVLNAMRFLRQTIPQVLEAARNTNGVDVLYVDNGSTDGSYEYLKSLLSKGIKLLSLQRGSDAATRNLSAAARNFGAYRTRSEFLSFLDADCVVAKNYFNEAVAVLQSTGAAATGCETEIPPEPHWIEATWRDLHYVGKARKVHYLNSANFFVSRQVFEEVGGFREDLPSGADSEIGQRLTNAGYLIFESPAVGAIHLGNPKSAREFYRRSVWHATGMLGTVSWHQIDKPTAMMGFHLLATIGGLVVLVASPRGLFVRLLITLLLQLAVPAITVAYRAAQTHRFRYVLEGIGLYWLYYWARIQALAILGVGRGHKYVK
jgi:glycosyltransferase involved in cell wall biosynthesis